MKNYILHIVGPAKEEHFKSKKEAYNRIFELLYKGYKIRNTIEAPEEKIVFITLKGV